MNKYIESFSKGSAQHVAGKFFNILGRSYKPYSMSPMPLGFERDGRTFEGFYGFTKDGEAIRIDFDVSGISDAISNIDIWNKPGNVDQPELSFDTEGMGIVEIYKEIIKFLGGEATSAIKDSEDLVESLRDKLSLIEAARGSTPKEFEDFVKASKLDPSLSTSKAYALYVNWAHKNNRDAIGNGSFYSLYSVYKHSQDDVPQEKGGKLSRASTASSPVSDEDDMDEFEQSLVKNEVLHKYDMFETVVEQILSGSPLYKNIFIGGVPGIGKSFSVKQKLISMGGNTTGKSKLKSGMNVTMIQGTISGFTGLLQVLWENRMPNNIIVLDDCDNLIQANAPQAIQNIWKVAMDTNEPRVIGWKTRKFSKPQSAEEARSEMFTADEETGFEDIDEGLVHDFLKGYQSNNSLYESKKKHIIQEGLGVEMTAQTDPSFGIGPTDPITDSFQFAGRIIFLSNLPYIPGPVADRCVTVMLNLSKEQVLQLIESRLAGVMKNVPEATKAVKKQALDFLKKYGKVTKNITFRQFEAIVMFILGGSPNWKEWSWIQLKGNALGK